MKLRIHETEITVVQIQAGLDRMKAGPFKAADIAEVARKHGPEKRGTCYVADRVADRLIQRQRKLGNIKVGSPYPTWHPVPAFALPKNT